MNLVTLALLGQLVNCHFKTLNLHRAGQLSSAWGGGANAAKLRHKLFHALLLPCIEKTRHSGWWVANEKKNGSFEAENVPYDATVLGNGLDRTGPEGLDAGVSAFWIIWKIEQTLMSHEYWMSHSNSFVKLEIFDKYHFHIFFIVQYFGSVRFNIRLKTTKYLNMLSYKFEMSLDKKYMKIYSNCHSN